MLANDLLRELLRTKESRFASVVYTSKETGEKALFLIHLNVNYRGILTRDLAVLSRTATPEVSYMSLAKEELQCSLRESLEGHNSRFTKAGYYSRLKVGYPVKYHKEVMYFDALVVSKRVLVPGVEKFVNHNKLTLAKNKLRKLLKTNKFREFRLDGVESARLNGRGI